MREGWSFELYFLDFKLPEFSPQSPECLAGSYSIGEDS